MFSFCSHGAQTRILAGECALGGIDRSRKLGAGFATEADEAIRICGEHVPAALRATRGANSFLNGDSYQNGILSGGNLTAIDDKSRTTGHDDSNKDVGEEHFLSGAGAW
jgi:hypothetical protein